MDSAGPEENILETMHHVVRGQGFVDNPSLIDNIFSTMLSPMILYGITI